MAERAIDKGVKSVVFDRGGSVYHGKVQALAPADLVTERSRTTVLIGSSGSGKSTLLRLMIGLIEPDSGEVDDEPNVVDEAPAPAPPRR